MIRTMVVEDEPFALRRICRLIAEADPEFQVLDTAMDGEEALEKLQNMPCDLVFTDIRMPVMDGVEFMRRMHDSAPDTMIVVVSGYSDFSYVSSALRYCAVDYLLKPIAAEDLKALLGRLRTEHQRRRDEALRRELSSRINRAVPADDSAENDAETADLGVFLFGAGAYPLCENPDLCPGSEFWGRTHFHDTLSELMHDRAEFFWEFMGATAAGRIVIVKSRDADMRVLARSIYARVAGNGSIPVTCVCHVAPVRLTQVERTLRELTAAARSETRIGQDRFVVLGESAPQADHSSVFTELAPLAAELFAGGGHQAEPGALTPLFARLRREDWPQADIFALLRMGLSQDSARAHVDFAESRRRFNALEEVLSASLSLEEVERDVLALCATPNAEDAGAESGGVATRIAAYLTEHYAEHITNQTLSALFGYVPGYLSLLFRREYNISPAEYLTNVRIERARRLLDGQRDMLIKDVAESVGFKSQYHFSHTFKKCEGVWPTDYRARNE